MHDSRMKIRNYRMEDSDEIADLFHGAVHSLVDENYSAEELEAWAPTPPDYEHWRERLSIKKPYVAERDGRIVGFIELEPDGHIDCFYTHKDFQRRGVGSELYEHLSREADVLGIQNFHVEASEVAKPFFLREGFVLERTNRLERGGQILTNYTMKLRRVAAPEEK
jgi:putative acetyltransferase